MAQRAEPSVPQRRPAGRAARWRFTNVAAQAGVAAPNDSFPAMFFDYDNDGWLDLFVGGYLAHGRRTSPPTTSA